MTRRILGVDPGKTSGLALFESRKLQVLAQVAPEAMWISLETYDPRIIVLEKFTYRAKYKVDFTPIEVIGVVKEWARQKGILVVEQTAANAMHYFTDAKLKERRLYEKGMPHAMDATRHVLYYLKAWTD